MFENKIKEGDNISFVIQDENYDKYKNEEGEEEEIEEEEENEEDDDSEDDEEEKEKVFESWAEEYKCEMLLKLIEKILSEPEGQKPELKLDKDSPEFLNFIKNKYHQIGMEIEEHEHKLIYTKTNFDWKCNECKKNKTKSESRLYCSICDYNMCNKCRKEKEYYKLGNIPDKVVPSNKTIKKQFIKTKGHEHRLAYCRTKRTACHGGWRCDKCRGEYTNKVWTFYCTNCDYDLCCKCAKKENLI